MSKEKKPLELTVKVTILVDAEDPTLCGQGCPGESESCECALFPLAGGTPRGLELADYSTPVRCRRCLSGETK